MYLDKLPYDVIWMGRQSLQT